jgi:hypothetical protein
VYVRGVPYLCTVDLVERLSKGATREWVGESGLQPALYFFYKGPLNIPAYLVVSDIVRTFGVKLYNTMKNFLTALFVGYVVVGVYKSVTKKSS